jgi:CIC family chloride channel protein
VDTLMKPNPPATRVDARFDEIAETFLGVLVNNLYVTDADEPAVGAIALHDIKPYLADAAVAEHVVARDIVLEDFPRVGPHQSLGEALAAFVGLTAERLPVVGADGRLLGSLSKSDLLLAMVEQRKRPA